VISVTPQDKYYGHLMVDLNFDVTYERVNEAVNVLHVYTDHQLSDEGADVAYWRPVETDYLTGSKYTGEGTLEKTSDGTTYSLDPTYGSSLSGLQRVVLIFAKAKPGYSISVDFSNGSAGNSHGMANAGSINELLSLNSGEWADCTNFQTIVQNAYNDAKDAGYTHFIAMVGPGNHLHDSEIAYSFVRAYKDEFYVEYDKGSLPARVEPKYIPQHEEHYSYGPYKWGDSFAVGQGLPQPEWEGYEFAGWKVAGTDLVYQQNAMLKLEGSEIAGAKTKVLYKGNAAVTSPNYSQVGIRLVAQWEPKPDVQEREVTIKHYLKKTDGTEELKLMETQTVLFYEGETEKTITALPKTFEGYAFDSRDTRNVVTATVQKDGTGQSELILYYKPIETNKVRIAYRESEGKFYWTSFENGDPKEYAYGESHTIYSIDEFNDMGIYPYYHGWIPKGWRITGDGSKEIYAAGNPLPINDITVDYAIRYRDGADTYYQIELEPVWNQYAFIAYTNDQEGQTDKEDSYFWRSLNDYEMVEDRFYIGEEHIIRSEEPTGSGKFLGWRLKNDSSQTIYKAGETFPVSEENFQCAIEYTWREATYGKAEYGVGMIYPPIFQYEFVPVWENDARTTGTLELTKEVIGAPAEDAARSFAFTLTATPPDGQTDKTLAGKTFPVEWTSGTGAESITFDENGKAAITLTANSSAKIKDLPEGWKIGISERTYYNYSAAYAGTYSSDDGTNESIPTPNSVVIRKDTTCSVTCTNTYTPPTGIYLQEGAWLGLLLIAGFMGFVMMLARRRRV